MKKGTDSMNNESMPSPPSRASTFWEHWCDGFWICFCFAMASLLAFTIPVTVLKRLASSVEGGTPRALTYQLGAVVIAIIGPLILSKAYRALEYPGTRKQRKTRPVELEPATSDF